MDIPTIQPTVLLNWATPKQKRWRDGLYYRVCNKNTDTFVMVSHGGSSSAALGHLLNLPFPFVCAAINPKFTAVTILSFSGENGSLITPRIEILNDARHIANIDTELFFGL